MKCPICDSELSHDEVDVGVGTMMYNERCDSCGWYPDRDDEDIHAYEHEVHE